MITPVSTHTLDPSLYQPIETDYGNRDDVKEELQNQAARVAESSEAHEQRLQVSRTASAQAAGVAIPDPAHIMPVLESQDERNGRSKTPAGAESLPLPVMENDTNMEPLTAGMSMAAALGFLIAQYLAEERQGNRIQMQDYRQRIVDSMERQATYITTAAIAGGAAGIVGGVLSLGGAAGGGYYLSKVDWNGRPATDLSTTDLPEMAGPKTSGRNAAGGGGDEVDAMADGLNRMMRNPTSVDRAVGPDGPSANSRMAAGTGPNAPIRGGLQGNPDATLHQSLPGMPGASSRPVNNRGGAAPNGLVGNPNAQVGTSLPGMPGASNRTGMGGTQGTTSGGLIGNSNPSIGNALPGLPGMSTRAPAPGLGTSAGSPVSGGLVGQPGAGVAVGRGSTGAMTTPSGRPLDPGIYRHSITGAPPGVTAPRIGTSTRPQDIDIPLPFGRQTAFGPPKSGTGRGEVPDGPIRGGLMGKEGDADMPSMPKNAATNKNNAANENAAINKNNAAGVDGEPMRGGLVGNPQATGKSGQADAAGDNGPIRGGIHGDPSLNETELPMGRPGQPGMRPDGANNQSGSQSRHGDGDGGAGAGGGRGQQDQPDGGTGGDRHASDGGLVDEMFEHDPGQAGGPLNSRGQRDFGMDPIANIQYYTALAQVMTQGGNGMNGLSNSGGQIGSGLANSAAKIEEAEAERARSLLDGVQSLDENVKETIRTMIDVSRSINDSNRATLQKILG